MATFKSILVREARNFVGKYFYENGRLPAEKVTTLLDQDRFACANPRTLEGRWYHASIYRLISRVWFEGHGREVSGNHLETRDFFTDRIPATTICTAVAALHHAISIGDREARKEKWVPKIGQGTHHQFQFSNRIILTRYPIYKRSF